jgi:2-methylcitrate dehydratase PrpD
MAPVQDAPNADVTDRIIAFLDGIASRDLPDDVLTEVEISFADTIGCILLGLDSPTTRILAGSPLHHTDGPVSATVLGSGERRSLLDVALIHGVAAHVADFDDISWALMGHPSATLVPALVPLAEYVGASGIELARAYLAGYEVAVELGFAIEPAHYLRGWHATCTIGSVAVAAGCARLLGLDPERTRHALGIAASSSSGLRQNFGSDVKSLHAGLAARNGIEAAVLARDGFTADRGALDGPWGFFRAFDGRSDVRLRSDAFSGFAIRTPGTLRKLYPSCGATHQAIDAAIEMRATGIEIGRIADVRVEVAPACLAPLRSELPTSPLEAKFSMEFCVAAALLDGAVRVDHFSDGVLSRPDLADLMPRIDMVAGDEFRDIPENGNDASAARVTITLDTGERRTVAVRHPSGSPERPLTPEQLRGKFRACTDGVLGGDRATVALESILGLRHQRDLDAVLAHLTP